MKEDILIFGGLLLDRYIKIDRWPERGQDGFMTDAMKFTGGCAINMAVAAHNLTQEDNDPLNIHVVSAMGSDAAAGDIITYMNVHGLSLAYTCDAKGPTGSCLVFVEPDGERTFLTRKGVEGDVSPELLKKIKNNGCKVAGVSGYYLLNDTADQILECLEYLKIEGTQILFDPSPLAGDIKADILEDMLKIADVITPNMSELSVLGGSEKISEWCAAGKTIILKSGAEGGSVYTPDESFDYNAHLVEPVDTTGAGDSFSGALLYAMAKGLSIHEAIDLAVECAAKAVMVFGPHGFW